MNLFALVIEQLEYDGRFRSFQMQAIPDRPLTVAFVDEFDEPHDGPFHFLDRLYQKTFAKGLAECRALKLSESQFAIEGGEYHFQISWHDIPTERNCLSCYALSLPEFAVPTEVRLKDPHSDREYQKSVIRDDRRNCFIVYLECRSSMGLFGFLAEVRFRRDQENFADAKYTDTQTNEHGAQFIPPVDLIPENFRSTVREFLSFVGEPSQSTPILPTTPDVATLAATSQQRSSYPKRLPKLPAKNDLSEWLDAANLTERQREVISLKFEYELGVSEIARRLGISRKTVDEHLEAAKKKVDCSRHRPKKNTNRF